MCVAWSCWLSGCLVGPGYVRPESAPPPAWRDAGDAAVASDAAPPERWWEGFGDPALVELVERAYAENLSLRAAGLRVVQAQARRAIAIGSLFPQEQAATGSFERVVRSENAAGGSGASGVLGGIGAGRVTDAWQIGVRSAWEIDLWGRFRRAIEAADAELLAAVADYDDVLVSRVAEVGSTYVQLRLVDERLAVARDNVDVQRESLRIARVRFESGGTSELDVAQAAALLHDTEARIPQLEIERRQAVNALCVLLGLPVQDLGPVVGDAGRLPEIPARVAVGVPADLLRRRPDVRAAEQRAAAQSARIGVATADLLPAFRIAGSIGVSAEHARKLFEGQPMAASFGPSFEWPVLNYGRLINDVRLQDAAFEEQLTTWAETVLVAQREVEDALIAFLLGRERAARLAESVAAANRAVELSLIQYREGATDFTSVLTTQQAKLQEDDQLAVVRGAVAGAVVSLFRSLGGGWEIAQGDDFVPAATRAAMRERTRWGGLLAPEARARDVEKARRDAEPRPWWKPRVWWPRW